MLLAEQVGENGEGVPGLAGEGHGEVGGVG